MTAVCMLEHRSAHPLYHLLFTESLVSAAPLLDDGAPAWYGLSSNHKYKLRGSYMIVPGRKRDPASQAQL